MMTTTGLSYRLAAYVFVYFISHHPTFLPAVSEYTAGSSEQGVPPTGRDRRTLASLLANKLLGLGLKQ